MGLVYKATDTRLDRAVAIKAINRAKLSRHGTADRLREEALTAASLDHPFICRIYELIEEGNETYIVMEFVEGETLATMMQRGHLALAETVRLFSEIAEGLANAHARGLVHRDIKPSNVMVTPHGHVKLLDFGIAQPDVASGPEADTKTSADAQAGRGGTPQYMSPEQATGAPITARADLFSLGVALYECLSGRLPFEGTTDYDYVHHLIASTPRPLHKLAPDAPDDLVQLVEQCLERTPAHRPESAAFVASELRRIGGHLTSPATTLESVRVVRRRRRRTVFVGAALVAVAGIAFATWQWMQPHWHPIGRNRPITTSPGRESRSRISPKGDWILYLASRGDARHVYVQQIDGLQPQAVSLPAGLYDGCVWSPDQAQFGCLVWHGDQPSVQIVPALFGGSPQQSFVIPATSRDIALDRWIGDAIFLTTRQSRGTMTLQRMNVASGVRTDVAGAWTSMSGVEAIAVRPDGREAVVLVSVPDVGNELWVADVGGAASKRLTPADDHFAKAYPVWSADGSSIVFQSVRGGQADLWEIDRRTGQQRRLTTSPAIEIPESVSADGSVSFQLIDETAVLWTWPAASAGAGRPLTEEALNTFAPTFSRDGKVVAFQRSLPSPREGFMVVDSTLIVRDVDGQTLRDDARDEGEGYLPRLSPDGSRLAYFQVNGQKAAKVRLKTRATGETLLLSENGALAAHVPSFPVVWSDQPMVWSPMSDVLYFVEKQGTEYRLRRDVVARGLEGLSTLRAINDRIGDLQISPDGRRLAYMVAATQGSQRSATATRPYELHVIDTSSGNDETWASFAADKKTTARGWTADGQNVLVVRTADTYDDQTKKIDLLLVSASRQVRPSGVIDHVVSDTLRMSATRPVLYVTCSVSGVANVNEWNLDTKALRPITDNALTDVTFSNVEPFGSDWLGGVRDVKKLDIWLLDARPAQARNTPGGPR